MENSIYLVLSSSSSVPAKLIRIFTKSLINHSSISLDDSLTCMYSFGRLQPSNPFCASFVTEQINKGFYEKFTDTYIKVYKIDVDKETYQKTKTYLEECYEHKDKFRYNFIGLALASINLPFGRQGSYFCSHFVAETLVNCGIANLKRNLRTYKPNYFEQDLSEMLDLIYEGSMADYSFSTQNIYSYV